MLCGVVRVLCVVDVVCNGCFVFDMCVVMVVILMYSTHVVCVVCCVFCLCCVYCIM